MSKIITTLLLLLVYVSCSKKSELKELFIADVNDYWEYRNYCYSDGGVYFQFKENGIYDQYNQYIDEGFSLFNNDGDLRNDLRPWSIKNDSTFVLNKGTYKIEKTSENEIFLSYNHYKTKNKKCYVRLSKWTVTSKGVQKLVADKTLKDCLKELSPR